MFAALGVVAERLGYACAEVGGRAVVGAEAVAVFYEVVGCCGGLGCVCSRSVIGRVCRDL